MGRIDESRPFIAVNIAVITVSDSRTLEDDKSGDLLVSRLQEAGHKLVSRHIVTDDVENIQSCVSTLLDQQTVDCIISTGGTGLTGRDVTPEAFRAVFDKEIEGFGEMFRYISFQKIGTSTLQSRAVAGVAKGTYMFALPGSPSACKDAWDDLLVHQLDYRHQPCNFVEIMPRLLEGGVTGRSSGKS